MIRKSSSHSDEATSTKKQRMPGSQLRNFSIKPVHKFNQGFPYFRQPIEFGHFSLDGQRRFHNDSSQLKSFQPPHVDYDLEYDLRDGYDSHIEKDDDIKERLTHLLTWIKRNTNKFRLNNENAKEQVHQLNTDFVAWRGHFTKFLCTPYETREPWKMAVTLFNGTIYISEVETEKAEFDRKHRSPRQKEMCYWGFRFEGYLTKPMHEACDEEEEKQPKVTNTNEAYCSIVRTRLKNHSILIGAEVDCCVKDSKAAPPLNYVELKTSRIMQHFKQRMNFSRYKLLKFWAQSFLVGLPKIVVGLRDDDGIVRELKTYKTMEIPQVCKEFRNCWDPTICMNFLDKLLSWLKQIVTIDNKDVVYMLRFEPPFDTIQVELIDDGSECFLPDWFVETFQTQEE
ncbi:decapping and exoribonuclease protein-like [Clytia hemisphaerica]